MTTVACRSWSFAGRARRCGAPAAAAVLLGAALAGAAPAQLIPVRVVPIAEADQFSFFPAANYGMANVSVAIADTLLDPFQNPALGARVRRAMYFGAPTFFTVSNNAGSGQAFPVGGILRAGRGFVGAALAMEEVIPARPHPREPQFGERLDVIGILPGGPVFPAASSEPRSNQHLYGTAGYSFGALSLALSGMWSELGALEGMDLLFAGSQSLRQRGDRSDVRLGLLRDWGTRSLQAVALRGRTRMTYDVGYAFPYWDPGTRRQVISVQHVQSDDDTRTTGLHVRYDQPIRDSSWRAGVVATMNRVDHASAPYYEFNGIPRDPSVTMAYNLGAGVSRQRAATTLALDVILEPAWRRATGTVDSLTLASAGPFAPGAVSERSYFKFANLVVRGGAARDFAMEGTDNRLRLQAGVQLRSVNYRLEQHDLLASAYRERSNSWREWTHSGGANFIFPSFEFAYQMRVLSGMGRLTAPPGGGVFPALDVFPGFPQNPSVTLFPVRVVSHQIFFSVPIR